ncbi:hypothetical protein R1sor_020639 [Riccia sorocarpa]|uniref:Uncharacterized protein n=1 Tax=Riccia sorocarpa TaxID=122646 RepID=A0ABD3GER3_9MARC
MERRRFTCAVALSIAVILLFGRLDVYVPAAAKDPLKTTLEKTLKKMSCKTTKEFIDARFLSSGSGMTEGVRGDASRVQAGTCEQEKEFIYSYISQLLPDAGQNHIGTKSWFSFPPAACLSCAASVCLAHDQCAKCCRKRHTTFCYDCP